MSKKVYRATLSSSSIEELKQKLIDYRNDLPNKCKILVQRLSEIGIATANIHINESPLGKYVTIQTNITPTAVGTRAILIGTGTVFQSEKYDDFNVLLAVEFGAGIHYNKSANPKADEFGLGVGTFPGQIHAFEDGWYYWDEKSNKWRYSHGIKATMPMYNASMSIQQNIVKIAREVFR